VADRSVSVLMTLSDLGKGSHFSGGFDPAAEHMCGEAHFYGVRHTPLQGGGAPMLSNFWGSFLFRHASFDAELPNFMW